jgi:hypothetical protein
LISKKIGFLPKIQRAKSSKLVIITLTSDLEPIAILDSENLSVGVHEETALKQRHQVTPEGVNFAAERDVGSMSQQKMGLSKTGKKQTSRG